MNCPRCGKPVIDGHVFCGHCGMSVSPKAASAASIEKTQLEQPEADVSVAQPAASALARPQKKKGAIIAVAVALAAVVTAVVVYVLFQTVWNEFSGPLADLKRGIYNTATAQSLTFETDDVSGKIVYNTDNRTQSMLITTDGSRLLFTDGMQYAVHDGGVTKSKDAAFDETFPFVIDASVAAAKGDAKAFADALYEIVGQPISEADAEKFLANIDDATWLKNELAYEVKDVSGGEEYRFTVKKDTVMALLDETEASALAKLPNVTATIYMTVTDDMLTEVSISVGSGAFTTSIDVGFTAIGETDIAADITEITAMNVMTTSVCEDCGQSNVSASADGRFLCETCRAKDELGDVLDGLTDLFG